MKRVIVVQARVRSTRLPGKVLLDLAGRPMLERQLERLKQCRAADDIIVATTRHGDDRPIVSLAGRVGVRWFRGSADDVLRRYVDAASQTQAEVVVRITSDCPLIDPVVTDRVIRELCAQPVHCDYASNVVRRTFPRGLDTEAMFADTLWRIDRLASSPHEREHVTIVPRSPRASLFLTRDVLDERDNSDLRWTVDTPEDLAMIREVYQELELADRMLPYGEVLAYVR
ncbi:MAG TPA: glycosyltransferase family protein, partial [Pirellulales bacterium]|nr:glycosyltransferase family protein [Pirellulales bacterium]